MRRRIREHGIGLFELIIAIGLLALGVMVIMTIVWQLSRSTARAANGSAELAIAARMAELFRNDVRQAQTASVSTKGDSVKLTLPDGVVEYRSNSKNRLERVMQNQSPERGPLVISVNFSVSQLTGEAKLVHAQWNCGAENNLRPDTTRRPSQVPVGRTLILDTAMRATAEAAP